MKNTLLAAISMLIVLSSIAQNRYLDEIFSDSEISIEKDLTYGINVDPLLNTSLLSPAYVQANAMQITAEKDSLLSQRPLYLH